MTKKPKKSKFWGLIFVFSSYFVSNFCISFKNLIVFGIFNTNHMTYRKIEAIESYLSLMEEWKQKNPIYYSRLLNKIVEILQRIDAFYAFTHKDNTEYGKAIEKILIIVNKIFFCLSKEENKDYHPSLHEQLYQISLVCRNLDKLLHEEIYVFLIKSQDLKKQNEVLECMKLLLERKKMENYNGFVQELPEIQNKISQKHEKYLENSKKLLNQRTFEKINNELNLGISNKALKTINFLLYFEKNSG